MKTINLLFLGAAILFLLSCANKKNDIILPKSANTSEADFRAAPIMDSVCGNYNPDATTSNIYNTFCVRYFKGVERRPLIITFHGGSYVGGNKEQFNLPLTIGKRFPVLLTTEDLDNNKFAYACANYRLLEDGNGLTIIDCLNDCKMFVEYMRDNADKYNIDPDKIILMGYSGGAGSSLWIGLRNNFISNVTIKGIVTFDAQATMNILEWRDQVFAPVGLGGAYEEKVVKPTLESPDLTTTLKLYYNTALPSKINKYSADNKLSLFNLFDSSDPELYMSCQAPYEDFTHHPAHTGALNARSKAAGHKSRIQYVKHPSEGPSAPFINPNYESLIQFFVRKFQ